MKTMKRALTLIMAVMMVAAMAACGNKPADITEMQVAGCFRIADKELVEACNQALTDMKADGTLYDLAVKYLSQDVADSLDVFTK